MAKKKPTHGDALAALERLAPLSLAESWDRVGLLVEAPRGAAARLKRILLTVDLSLAVMEEALEQKVDFIVSYHPPIFEALSSLTRKCPKERIILAAVRAGMAIYSPHTALDAVDGGINDWLAEGCGSGKVQPIRHVDVRGMGHKLVVYVPLEHEVQVRDALFAAGMGEIGDYSACSFRAQGQGTFRPGSKSSPYVGQANQLEKVDEVRLELLCPIELAGRVPTLLQEFHPYEEPAWEIYELLPRADLRQGQGRSLTLAKACKWETVLRRLKTHLGLAKIRVAVADQHRAGASIDRIDLCPGAGGSLLASSPADLIVTGEMRHHDVLAANERGQSVFLCEHTNSERGYLPRFAKDLRSSLGKSVEVCVSKADRDPFEYR